MDDIVLTPDERRAIATLKRLAKTWPRTLWLYSASGTLCVMRKGPNGEDVETPSGGADPGLLVETIYGIDNDGGDW